MLGPQIWQLVGILTNLGGCLRFKKFDVKCPKYFYLCVFYRSEQAREREGGRERVIAKKKTYIIDKYFRVASLSIHFIYIYIQHLHLHFHFIYIQLNKNRCNRKTSWSTFQKWYGFSSPLAPGLLEDRITILSLYGHIRVREVSYFTQRKQSAIWLITISSREVNLRCKLPVP